MADILLLEPGYKNKYPPMGLMKISYFHKYVVGDYVRFAKGKLPDAFKDKKWDRVYVTTLFTFEWENTKKAIEYALTVVKDPTQVYTGGILATLMPDLITSTFPTVKNNTGLLNRPGTLGIKGEECVDTMPLDYAILDDIADEYVYPAHDAYFTYMTRGCGMKCQFCAVQTLEPDYIPYLSITESIRFIEKKFGPKKDLLLMDNNVLRSPHFDEIVDEIIALGFGKGATFINPKTGKRVQRYVDFNQGLDAFLLTPHKAKRLGELAIRPARIAFDHIEDVEAYKRAITLCAENGITHMSNYMLYNGDDFKGKGHTYHADTPEDLYNRMKISLDLSEELTERMGHQIALFSFPMRYIPLSDLKRGYVGAKWNSKYLRSFQRMLIPTQGKGVSSRSFFEACFGKSAEEFVEFLAMPEEILAIRGHFVERKDEDPLLRETRYSQWLKNQRTIKEWTDLFRALGERKEEFVNFISTNDYSAEKYLELPNYEMRKLFVFYMTIPAILKIFNIADEAIRQETLKIITEEYPDIYGALIKHVSSIKLPFSMLEGIYKTIPEKFAQDVLRSVDILSESAKGIIGNLTKVQAKTQIKTFDYQLIGIVPLYYAAGVISQTEYKTVSKLIEELNSKEVKSFLLKYYDEFLQVLKEKAQSEEAAGYLIKEIETSLDLISKQLTLFDEEDS